jgi:hypothetical protein
MRVSVFLALLGLCGGLLAPATAEARKKAKAVVRKGVQSANRAERGESRAHSGLAGEGRVQDVAGGLVYLDRGTTEGLRLGFGLELRRGARGVGRCTVESVAEHWSTCALPSARSGDTFTLPKQVAAGADEKDEAQLVLPEAAEVQKRRTTLAAQAWKPVAFSMATRPLPGRTIASASLSHTSFGNAASTRRTFDAQRVDVAVYDFELYRGLRFSVDATVLNFSARPADARTRYQATPALLVRQLELGFRRDDVALTAAAGRLWARNTPGIWVLDGAQASWRATPRFEVGLYGGLLPNAVFLTPQFTSWAAGAFAATRTSFGAGADATSFEIEGRAGWSVRERLGGRFEVGASAHAYAGRSLDAHATVELGAGQAQAWAALDAARLDVGARLLAPLRLVGSLRYRGLALGGLTELGQISPGLRAVHGDASVQLELAPQLWISVAGGAASDFDAGLKQFRVGPEISLPGLLGKGGGLKVGYAEEFGWLRARSGWAQVSHRPLRMLRLMGRASWFHQARAPSTEGLEGHEVGAAVGVELTVARWLWARGALTGRLQVERPKELAGVLSVSLGGSL